MLKQFCQTAKLCRKGSGLTDFFSILAFALVIVVFYGLFQLTIGGSKFEVAPQSKSIEDSLSLLSILRTNVDSNNVKMNVAELIALSYSDTSKKSRLEKNITKILDDSFGVARCAIFCIDKNQIKSSGCSTNTANQVCSNDFIQIHGYYNKPVKVSLKSGIEPLNPRSMD